MAITDLLKAVRIALNMRVRDKRALIMELAVQAAVHAPGIPAAAIEQALLAREQLGSTGLGDGFALPHARIEGLGHFVGLFARLSRPIDVQAIDGKPVDLVFLLLIPGEADDHVGVLAAVARRFRDAAVRQALRKAATPDDALRILAAS